MASFQPTPLRAALLALLLAATALPAAAAEPLAPADFHLDDYADTVVLVDFWASWCKPCSVSLPWLSQLAETYADQGLVIVAVNLDKKLASAEGMLTELDPHIVVVHDPAGELAEQYDLAGMPSAYLYDRAGELHAQHVGFQLADAPTREHEIAALLKQEAPTDAH